MSQGRRKKIGRISKTQIGRRLRRRRWWWWQQRGRRRRKRRWRRRRKRRVSGVVVVDLETESAFLSVVDSLRGEEMDTEPVFDSYEHKMTIIRKRKQNNTN